MGFDIHRISSNKQIGAENNQDNQVINSTVDLYGFYKSENRKYHALFHVLSFGHAVEESGGIKLRSEPELPQDYWLYKNGGHMAENSRKQGQKESGFIFIRIIQSNHFFEIYHNHGTKDIQPTHIPIQVRMMTIMTV